MVANLWDVTDRDIDRFSQSLLQTWVGSKEEEDSLQGRVCCGASSVSAAVNASRGACRLSHLIGAAPVCYGLPSSVVFRRG